MKWASQRNIRITVKGTGHDLNGRSSGAYSLSIWTRNFNHITYHDTWTLPSNATEPHVISFGSGNGWGPILTTALQHNRVVTTGQDPSVGPGGYIQGGGHGPLSRTYGLGAHQVLQATIITTNGTTLTANAATNPDLFWALRGGGGGQYGVVTEYVIKTHPAPRVTTGTLSLLPSTASPNASWPAAAALLALLPSLQDAGLAGAATLATGASATRFSPALDAPTAGVVATQVLWGLNMTSAALTALVAPVAAAVRAAANGSVAVSWAPGNQTDYATFFAAISGSDAAGSGAVASSRLLGRRHLGGLPREKLTAFLRGSLAARNQTAGTFVTVGLQGGPGVAGVEEGSWGAVNPV
ncbi:putative isoamyl alcohol protein [Neofusicoccum parvum UCRNP2]|uniref:Putative isoamyl alcohol protein n=1 Tax=Botryosphaeria parva (strain UCR-NP2) TaxID=1287680 RepID=R1H2B7_BOTPV|nr:putative isoamyl alcohol protein [Neofusicoccum parvum UCRNP2]